MTTVEPPGANEPLDELDLRLLAGVRELWEDADPMPATLVDQIRFAIQLEDVDLEVMRIREQERLADARSAAEQGRLITFDSESLTIMVNVSPEPGGTIRLDGWLTPPAEHPIEVRTSSGPLTTTSDAEGRFAVSGVSHGMVQVLVRTAGRSRTVSTPAIEL
ncbi:hypothetical protein [Amycolatopsis rifamycinica]|uniref:Carboxypeptidase regulatory-like domain-containing protein n=1 Tax=Amycolatopsis rifamycinica TaxID=287986 RepID=A0A066U3E0_9PSEU|nr:hypothetical protein [Amycolatopsis rifamycinica]KDN20387.1 hypothetical protein DV20_20780 [Amycolatopsis rifamycinica]